MSECDCVSPTFCDVAGCIKAMPDPRDAEIATLRAEVERLRGVLHDMRAGWRYIRRHHGDLSGVGWERCEKAATDALGDHGYDIPGDLPAIAARALAPKP